MEIEDYDDIEDEWDGQNQDKADADQDREDEEVQHKGQIKRGSPQKGIIWLLLELVSSSLYADVLLTIAFSLMTL